MLKYLIVIIGLIFVTSCVNETQDPEKVELPAAEISFSNSSPNYELEEYDVEIEFTVNNVSAEEIKLYARPWRNKLLISRIVDQKVNDKWLIFDETMSDTLISILPGELLTDIFYCFYPGDLKLKIPITLSNNEIDTIISPMVTVENSFQDSLAYNLNYSNVDSSLSISIINNSSDTLKLRQEVWPYCHFTFLSYEILENNSLTRLFYNQGWDIGKWTRERLTGGTICFSDPTDIFINPGEVFDEKRRLIFPQGKILARMWFSVGVNYDQTRSAIVEFDVN